MKRCERGIAPVAVVLIIVGILVVLGGGFYALASQGGPLADAAARMGLPVKTDAERVIDAVVLTQEQQYATVDLVLQMNGMAPGTDLSLPVPGAGMNDGGPEQVDVKISLRSEGVSLSGEEVPHQGRFIVEGSAKDSTESVEGKFDVEYRSVNDKLFFRIDQDSTLEGLGISLASLFGTWYELDLGPLKEFTRQFEEQMEETQEEPACENEALLEERLESLTPADLEMTVTRLGKENVSDEAATRYLVAVDVDHVFDTVIDIFREAGCPGVEELDAQRDKANDAVINSMTVLIGKDSGLIREVAMDVELGESGDELDLDTIVIVKLSDFNEVPTVEEPSPTADLMQAIFGVMFGAMMEGQMGEGMMMEGGDGMMMEQ